MADAVGIVGSGLGHARAHQSGVVGLDLEVYVVGMRIVFPVTRSRGLDAVEDVVAGTLIGRPQGIASGGEGVGKVGDGCVEPLLLEDVYESEVHVDVVVQSGQVLVVMGHQGVVPGYVGRVGYHASGILKLGGATIGTAYGLASPSALDLVEQRGPAQGNSLGLCAQGQHGSCH